MTSVNVAKTPSRGGAWLLEPTALGTIWTPERLTEEHRLIAQTTHEFVGSEVLTVVDRLEAKEWGLSRQLIKRCGELGLLGTDAPEAYGGLALDMASSVIVAEGIGEAASFSVTFGAVTGLSIMPLLMFGTEEQKRRYLPGLVSGEVVGAYALSESGSG